MANLLHGLRGQSLTIKERLIFDLFLGQTHDAPEFQNCFKYQRKHFGNSWNDMLAEPYNCVRVAWHNMMCMLSVENQKVF